MSSTLIRRLLLGGTVAAALAGAVLPVSGRTASAAPRPPCDAACAAAASARWSAILFQLDRMIIYPNYDRTDPTTYGYPATDATKGE